MGVSQLSFTIWYICSHSTFACFKNEMPIFTYGLAKGLSRLADAKVENHSLSNLDALVEVAAEEGYIAKEDIDRILRFRANPSDPSWMD